MEEKEVKKIRYMSDFADLFLAIYSLKKNVSKEHDKLYLPNNFHDIAINVLMRRPLGIIELLDEDGVFKMDEFFEKIKSSTIRKYWAEDFRYDLQKGLIFSEINVKNIMPEIEKYNLESIKLIENIVGFFIISEKEMENNAKKYTYLYKKSDD